MIGQEKDEQRLTQTIDMKIEMPQVRTTKQEIEKFDIQRIVDSLVKETKISEVTARNVANKVARIIYVGEIDWLSGPLIRGMCGTVLAQMKLHEARKIYTRIGMPLMDYEHLVLHGSRENANQYKNPEAVQAWAGNRVAAEYALLRLLPEHLSKAHLLGDIHIHKLKYFDMRPFCAGWDLRMIFYCGLPPGGSVHSASSSPAKHPQVAMLHAAKWLGIIQGSFQGGQGFDHFTAFSSPMLVGMTDQEIEQMAQCFVYETNQIYAARGGQVPFTSMHCSPEIPEEIRELPAVGLGGKIVGIYGDYQEENKRFFDAICRVEMKGDRYSKLFAFPKHEIEMRREWLKKHEDSYMLVMQEIAKMGTPYLILYPDWMPKDASCQCCRIILTKEGTKRFCRDVEKLMWDHSYINIGSIQTVSINLPRLAYRANGDDNLLYEFLVEQLENTREVLLIKKEITEKRYHEDPLLNKIIPFPNGRDQPLFDMDRYSLTVGYVGLNEMLKAHLGVEMHEDKSAVAFGLKMIKFMKETLERYSIENQYNFTLWEQPAESASNRFAWIDARKFKNAIVNGSEESAYYTNSNHVRYDSGSSLFDIIDIQAQFHPIVQGGVITHLWLGEAYPEPKALFNFTSRIMHTTPTAYIAYTKDFTFCLDCKIFSSGRQTTCSTCGSTNIEWYSRVTGYYSRVSGFSDGKKKEWQDRNLHNL